MMTKAIAYYGLDLNPVTGKLPFHPNGTLGAIFLNLPTLYNVQDKHGRREFVLIKI